MSDTQYIVSARKYRPSTFSSVVGQTSLTSTLKNAIEQNHLAQAYLFTGPRGVGKTSCARIFARTINCLSPGPDGEACGQCDSCRAIDAGSSFNIIELDAASNNSVNDIRALCDQVNIPPQVGKYRVFIIDEVHMLSSQAFNAFLKTLEEPPKYVIFILATTEKHKVIPTILSRCQIYDFKRITIADMVEHLKYVASSQGVTAETAALNEIAKKADGAMRDALSIFDQVAASSRGNITYENAIENLNVLDHAFYFRLIDAFAAGDTAEALMIYKEIRDKGFDSLFFVNGLAGHVRDLMVAADEKSLPLLDAADDVAEKMKSQAAMLPLPWYYAALKLLSDCDLNYRTSSSKRLLVELTLVRLSQLLKPATPPFDKLDYTPPMRSLSGNSQKSESPQSAPAAPAQSAPATAEPKPQPGPSQSAPHAAAHPAAQASYSSPAPAPAYGQPKGGARRVAGVQMHRLSDIGSNDRTDSRQTRNAEVTSEGFMTAWNEFIAANGDMHILTSAMRAGAPKQTSPTEFLVLVSHPAQQQAFESSMPKLLKSLRDRLGNDMLTVKVDIDKDIKTVKKLPPKEFLNKIVSENPVMRDFLKSIDAEMS